MNFDYGNTLMRAWQITWRNKVLWLIMTLPVLLSFLAFFPFFIFPVFVLNGDTSETTINILGILAISFFFIFFIAAMAFHVIATSSATLGVIRAERGEGSMNFMDLLRGGFPYFGRSLGAFLIIQLGIGLIFTVFFMLVFLLSIVTMGIATICLQPIMLLLSPLMYLVIAVMEAAQTAIIAENLGAVEAVKRAIEVVREHVWKYVIITLIIYFGATILMSFIIFPIMLPAFFFPFLIGSGSEISTQALTLIFIGFMCLFFPLMALFSGLLQAFMKSALNLTYLQLTQPGEEAPVFIEANA